MTVSAERIARVWLWLSWMHDQDGDSIHYSWPPDEDDAADEEEAYERAQACAARADAVLPGASRERWRDALDTFVDPNFDPERP